MNHGFLLYAMTLYFFFAAPMYPAHYYSNTTLQQPLIKKKEKYDDGLVVDLTTLEKSTSLYKKLKRLQPNDTNEIRIDLQTLDEENRNELLQSLKKIDESHPLNKCEKIILAVYAAIAGIGVCTIFAYGLWGIVMRILGKSLA